MSSGRAPSVWRRACGCRYTSTSRGYPEALERLSQLQPNRRVANLFEASPSPQALHAAAIPEVLAWLRRAGYTPDDLSRMRHIHVAGTKGKGSVCAYATSMLRKHRAVGTYTSPHLVSPRERIAIDGDAVGEELFATAFFELWDRFTEAAAREGMAAEAAEGPASKPFFFRFLTILAWHVFLREGVADVVMECGIGGEFDATNVLPREAVSAAVVTQLGIDHVAMLGDTVQKIAWHKAGIFKAGVKAFAMRGDGPPGVMTVLRQRAAEKGAELVEFDAGLVEQWGGVRGILQGDFQKTNQALAVMAVREHLGMAGSPAAALHDMPADMAQGLREAALRGRCEAVDDGQVAWLLDGAHTQDSLEQVAKWLMQHLEGGESLTLVFNQQERDAAQLLAGFVDAVTRAARRDDVFRRALFPRNDLARLAGGGQRDTGVQEQAAVTMRRLVPGCQTRTFDNVADCVAEARRRSKKVLVTGSLYLVGAVLQALEPESLP